jgi:hypothetical protein
VFWLCFLAIVRLMTTAAAFVAYPYTNRGGYGCVRHACTQAYIMATENVPSPAKK